MNKSTLIRGLRNVGRTLSKNSPAILIGLSIFGGVTAAVMAVKNAPDAKDELEEVDRHYDEPQPTKEIVLEKAKIVTKYYGPAITVGVCAIVCAVSSLHISNRRLASYTSAYYITDAAYREFREQVQKQVGETKTKKIDSAIAQDHVDKNPPNEDDIFWTGDGNTLFLDDYSGRYFYSDISAIREGINNITARILQRNEMYCSLNDFYREIHLADVGCGRDVGWNVDHLPSMSEPDAVWVSAKGRPCGVIVFNEPPTSKYDKVYGI